MSGRPGLRRRAAAAAAAAGLLAAILLTAAAAGFLYYRFTTPRPTLYELSRQTPTGTSGAAAAVTEPAAPATLPARPIPEELPDLTLPGADGASHRLRDWRGRPLLINFWATWCEPCRREIPLLETLRRERAGEHLEIVGVALDSPEPVRGYMARHAIDYPVLIGEHDAWAATSAFGMQAVLPFSVFADREGRVITVKVGELHQDEAKLILDRIRDLDAGSLGLAAAREAISQDIERLSAARARSSQMPPRS